MFFGGDVFEKVTPVTPNSELFFKIVVKKKPLQDVKEPKLIYNKKW